MPATPRPGRWWLPAVLGVEILLFLPSLMAPGIIRAPLPKISESTGLFYPWALFWRDEVLAGRPPFWNSYVFGGMPIVGEPQAHTFYPGHLLWLILPPEPAFKCAFLIHVLLSSWLMYRLARELDANRCGAAISALVYGLHGQMIGFIYAGWIHQVMPMAWAPGVIWMLCRAFRSPDRWPRKPIALAGALLGVQIVSGHPEWVRYTLFIAAILTIGGVRGRLAEVRRPFVARLRITATAVVLGLLISGIQLLPLVQAAGHSARAHRAVATGSVRTGAGVPLLTLPTIVAPRLFGPWDQSLTVDGLVHKLSGSLVNYSESLIYVGVLPLLLALVAWRRRRETGAGTWIAVGLTGILFALNDRTHLQDLLDRVITLDAVFRSPARFVFLANFALAVLAGLGASQLHAASRHARLAGRVALVVAAGGAAAALVVWALRPTLVDWAVSRIQLPPYLAADSQLAADGGRSLGAWAIGRAVLWTLAAALTTGVAGAIALWSARRFDAIVRTVVVSCISVDLAIFAFPLLKSVVATERAYARDAALLAPVIGESSVRVTAPHLSAFAAGDNATMVFRVRSLIGYDSFTLEEWDRLWQATSTTEPEALSAAGVTHILTSTPTAPPTLTALDNPRGHAWWADRAAIVPTSDVTLDVPPDLQAAHAKVAIDEDVPGRLRATVDAHRPGWLVFTEVIYPGWIARVNGAPAPIARAFGTFQAVQVPAGQSTVEFAFRPTIVWWGLAMTLVGLLAGALLCRSSSKSPKVLRSKGSGPESHSGCRT